MSEYLLMAGVVVHITTRKQATGVQGCSGCQVIRHMRQEHGNTQTGERCCPRYVKSSLYFLDIGGS